MMESNAHECGKRRVLSLSTVFPNPVEPNLGLFVRSRLLHLASLPDTVEVKVVSPIGVLDYANFRRKFFRAWGVPRKWWDGELEVLCPRWIYPPHGGFLNAVCLFLALLVPLASLRRQFRFELIDAHFAYPDGIAAALLASMFGCPFFITLRGNETEFARKRWHRRLIAWSFRRARRIITVSERLRQFAIQMGADPEHVVTIPNGIDTGLYFPRDRRESRRKHGFPADAPALVSVGYLIERKGHHKVIAALKRLRAQGIEAELFIVGGPGREGEYEHRIRQVVSQLGLENVVHFLGVVAPGILAELMSAADVLCLASNREGWPNVVHEALACGTPVVATDVGGVPDMIPSPDYGFVVPIDDQVSLERALLEACRKRWDRGAIATWGQSRTWQHVAKEILREIHQTLDMVADQGANKTCES